MEVTNFYPHYCIISRSKGKVDAKGNELTGTLYSGKCGLQYGMSGNTYLQGYSYQSAPNVIVPITDVQFKISDIVIVTDGSGRDIEFTVEQAEVVKDAEVGGTTLWLKQGEDNNG